jgi:hypothetical protein
VDPQYSFTSNATSSSHATSASYTTSASGESKDEASSDSYANDFVQATLLLFEESLEQMAWYKGTKYKLEETYLPLAIMLILGPSKKWNLS